jgi:type II secretory pathway pseudopilin PulG
LAKGFTLIELVLVVGLIFIILGGAFVFNSGWYLQNNFDSTKNILVSSLRKAQNYSLIKKNNLTWGVCLTNNIVRMFGGSCTSPTIKDDYILPNIVISGLTTITFSPLRGEPNTPQNVTVSGNNKSIHIIINQAGGISQN